MPVEEKATAEFAGIVPSDLGGEILEDSRVDQLLARLDSLLNGSETTRDARMLDLYRDHSVVLLGVNSDSRLRTVREAKQREGLSYRTWWDGGTDGPIAAGWNVRTWPSTFILDAEGVIRFVDKRKNGMILAVDQLLEEERAGAGK